jgi:hypothetical protein
LFYISLAHAGTGRPCNLTQDLQHNFCVLQDTQADMRIVTLSIQEDKVTLTWSMLA